MTTTSLKNVIVEFDYTKQTLEEIKKEALAINKEDKEELKKAIKILVKARTTIQKKGKSYRDEANAFNKMVLAKEKEYLGIVKPIEDEYKELIKEMEEREIREARKVMLPMKKKQLEALSGIVIPDDEFLLSLDEEQYANFYQDKMRESQQIEEEKARQKAREEQIRKEAEERAKKEAEQKLAEEKRKLAEQVEREKKEKELAEKKAREEKEAQAKKLQADKEFEEYKKSIGFNKETDKIKTLPNGDVEIYRLIGVYKLKK